MKSIMMTMTPSSKHVEGFRDGWVFVYSGNFLEELPAGWCEHVHVVILAR